MKNTYNYMGILEKDLYKIIVHEKDPSLWPGGVTKIVAALKDASFSDTYRIGICKKILEAYAVKEGDSGEEKKAVWDCFEMLDKVRDRFVRAQFIKRRHDSMLNTTPKSKSMVS